MEVLFYSAGITFGRVVDGKVCCVHLAWPLTLVIVVKNAPYCLPRKTVGRKTMTTEPRAAKRSGAAGPFFDCPTRNNAGTAKLNPPSNPQLPDSNFFFGSLNRFFFLKRNGLDWGVGLAPHRSPYCQCGEHTWAVGCSRTSLSLPDSYQTGRWGSPTSHITTLVIK